MPKVRELLRGKGGEIHSISPEAPVSEAARTLVAKQVSSLAVCEGDRIVGIFTRNDLTRCCGEHADRIVDAKVSEFMRAPVFTTTPDADLDEVIATMIREGFHHAPIRAAETIVGMITSSDILAYQCRRLLGEEEELLRYIRGSY